MKTRREAISDFLDFAGGNWKQTIPASWLEAWCEELADLPIELLETALKRARGGIHRPNIGDVRAIASRIAEAHQIEPLHQGARALLDRGDKPPDWEPLSDAERAELFKKFKVRVETAAAKLAMPQPLGLDDQERHVEKLRTQARQLIAEDLRRKVGQLLGPEGDVIPEAPREQTEAMEFIGPEGLVM